MQRLWGSLILVAALSGLAGAQQAEPNLIPEGNFEGALESRGLPRGWYHFQRPAGAFQAQVTPDGRAGTKALRLSGEGEYSGVGTQSVPHDPGKIYAGRVWVKLAGAESEAFVKLDYRNATGGYVASSREVRLRGGGADWQPLSLSERGWEVPAGVAQTSLVFGARGKADVLFDDAEFVARDGGGRTNLLADGSLEVLAGETHARWRMAQAQGGTVRRVRRSVPVRDGWFCVELAGPAAWAVVETDAVDLQPGKKYVLTGWVRVRQGRGALKLSYLGPNGYLGQTLSEYHAANEWKQLRLAAEPEKFPGCTKLGAAGSASGPEMAVFFDGFHLSAE
jgi:hypothetical protein